jgi:signal transduction histidine kinase
VIRALAVPTILAAGQPRAARRAIARSSEDLTIAASSRRFVLAALLVPTVLFALLGWQERARVLRDARKDAARTTAIFYQHARNVFATHMLAAAVVDEKIRGMGWDEIGHSAKLQQDLAAIASRYPQIAALALIDPNGIVRNASIPLPAPPLSAVDRDYFVALRARDLGVFIDVPTVGRVTGHLHFNIAVRRTSISRKFDGVIVVSVRSSYFTDFWNRSASGADIAAKLFRSDGAILVRVPLPHAEARLAADSPLMQAIRDGDAGSVRAVSNVDGIERFYNYQKIDAFPVYIVYGVGVQATLQRWQQHLIVYGGLFGSAAIALTLMALAFARSARREAAALRDARASRSQLKAEAERRVVTEGQLHQSLKMDALGKMLGGVVHDFRNVMTILIGNLELLQLRIAERDSKRLLKNALLTAERAMKVIDVLLAFTRKQPLRSEIFNVNEALTNVTPMLHQALPPDVKLEMALEPGALLVVADSNQMTLAVLNLVMNARDAMPRGGVVRIRSDIVTLAGEIDDLIGDFVRLTISDTGTGIAPKLLSRVFEPYYTTKGPGRGTGLGLSIVHGFAKQSGGGVAIDSVVGQGTTMTLYLPAATSTNLSTGDRLNS